MSGLEVVDETTFTVKLTSPQSDFPQRLGYSAYMPMPPAAFEDPAGYGEQPVSNGPYLVDSWTHDQEIVMIPNPDYDGPRAAQNGGVTFTMYDNPDTAYNDLQGGNLDVLDQIPTGALQTYQDELGDRAVNAPGAVFQSITIPQNNPNFEGEVGTKRRKAISRAIDRATICSQLFADTRTPATDFVAPVVPGGGDDSIPGNEVLQFDEAEAKSLWDEAEAEQPFEGEFVLNYNADGPHQDWVEAVCNGLTNVLGITATPTPFPAFGAFREQITAREMEGAWRSGWQADYPSAYNFLQPLYSSAAADGNGSNDGDYKNPEFDDLLDEGQSATDEEAAVQKYHDAEAILLEDLPAIPLWYQNTIGGYSEAVSDVIFGWDTVPLYYQITK